LQFFQRFHGQSRDAAGMLSCEFKHTALGSVKATTSALPSRAYFEERSGS